MFCFRERRGGMAGGGRRVGAWGARRGASGKGGGGRVERAFLGKIGGAKAGARHFRAGASRSTARGQESCSGRPRSAIIGKPALRFRVGLRQSSQEKPCWPVLRTADRGGWRGQGARGGEGPFSRGAPPIFARKALLARPADGGQRAKEGGDSGPALPTSGSERGGRERQ